MCRSIKHSAHEWNARTDQRIKVPPPSLSLPSHHTRSSQNLPREVVPLLAQAQELAKEMIRALRKLLLILGERGSLDFRWHFHLHCLAGNSGTTFFLAADDQKIIQELQAYIEAQPRSRRAAHASHALIDLCTLLECPRSRPAVLDPATSAVGMCSLRRRWTTSRRSSPSRKRFSIFTVCLRANLFSLYAMQPASIHTQ